MNLNLISKTISVKDKQLKCSWTKEMSDDLKAYTGFSTYSGYYKYKYENQIEVDRIIHKHKDHLYTFMTSIDEKDRLIRNRIIIAFVRIAQKGNVLAEREIIIWVTYVVDDWVERYWQIRRWNGYTDEIEDKIRGCIRRYRYTGSFLGYLFKTLEYSARGIAPLQKYSLDDPVFDGDETRVNYVIHDQQSVI